MSPGFQSLCVLVCPTKPFLMDFFKGFLVGVFFPLLSQECGREGERKKIFLLPLEQLSSPQHSSFQLMQRWKGGGHTIRHLFKLWTIHLWEQLLFSLQDTLGAALEWVGREWGEPTPSSYISPPPIQICEKMCLGWRERERENEPSSSLGSPPLLPHS